MKIKQMAIGAVIGVGLFGSVSAAEYQQGKWVFSPHYGISPSNFVNPLAMNAVVSSDPVLPAPAVVVPNVGVVIPIDEELESPNLQIVQGTSVGITTKKNYRGLYKMPRTLGLDIGFMFMPETEFFFGYQFLRAEGKSFVLLNEKLNGTTYLLRAKLKGYDAHLGYLGVRRYFEMYPCFKPFIGLKLGGTQNKQGSANLTLDNGVKINGTSNFNVPAYFNTIGFVGGPQAGFDYNFKPGYSFYFAVEALAKTSHYADSRPACFTDGLPNSVKLFTQVTNYSTNSWSFPLVFGFRIFR